MKFLYGIIIAFSMYSKIPMPKIEWSKERMEYVMCFFPLVGVVLAVLTWASGILWFSLRPGDLLRAVVGACLPILVTGGIHLDGFLDVVDARASWQTPERRREILKDPHTGAFAIIWACVYFCAYVGCITELKLEYYLPFGGVFVAVRALSGLSVVLFPKASETGLAATFSKGVYPGAGGAVSLLLPRVCAGVRRHHGGPGGIFPPAGGDRLSGGADRLKYLEVGV